MKYQRTKPRSVFFFIFQSACLQYICAGSMLTHSSLQQFMILQRVLFQFRFISIDIAANKNKHTPWYLRTYSCMSSCTSPSSRAYARSGSTANLNQRNRSTAHNTCVINPMGRDKFSHQRSIFTAATETYRADRPLSFSIAFYRRVRGLSSSVSPFVSRDAPCRHG